MSRGRKRLLTEQKLGSMGWYWALANEAGLSYAALERRFPSRPMKGISGGEDNDESVMRPRLKGALPSKFQRTNRFRNFRDGKHWPDSQLVSDVEKRYPGLKNWLHHPLFELMDRSTAATKPLPFPKPLFEVIDEFIALNSKVGELLEIEKSVWNTPKWMKTTDDQVTKIESLRSGEKIETWFALAIIFYLATQEANPVIVDLGYRALLDRVDLLQIHPIFGPMVDVLTDVVARHHSEWTS